MMLLNTFVVKNVFQSLSRSVLCGYLPKLTPSKIEASDSMMLMPMAQHSFQLRSFCSDPEEDDLQKFLNSLTTEERDWLTRIDLVSERLCYYHEWAGESGFYRSPSLYENGSKFPSVEKEKYTYRERWATYRLLNKIEDVARRLIDDNVDDKCQVFYLVQQFEKWILDCEVKDAHYDQCWQSLLESSKVPLAQQLRNKLNEVGITPLTFSQSMNNVYLKLVDKCIHLPPWSIEVVNFKPEDIQEVLKNLPTNDTEYKCIKVLFNLEESNKWQIKDCGKV